MHPDLQRRLVRFLLNRRQQVVIATHSVEMIAEVHPSELVPIDSARRRSHRAQDTADVQRVVDQVGGVHNIEFARLSQSDRYLVIAAPELRLLKRWYDVVAPEATDALDLMPTFPLNTWEDWPYAVAMKRAIESRRDDPVTAVCILAPGIRSRDEVAVRRSEAAAEGMQLHVWSRRDLANFALNPTVIARAIRANATDSGPTPAQVASRMDAIMDSLVEKAVETAADREDEIRAGWRSLEGRLAMVPANLVLLRLAAWSRREYGVSVGIADVVAAFRHEDLDGEVVAVLDALCKRMALNDIHERTGEDPLWPGLHVGTEASDAEAPRSVQVDDVLDLLRDAGVFQ
jgi:hypothetical protein